jgi:hypothetical protein
VASSGANNLDSRRSETAATDHGSAVASQARHVLFLGF